MYNKNLTIIKNDEIMPGHRLLCLNAPEIARASSPGQFLHVRCSQTLDPLLRRPLSIHYADRVKGRVYLLYRVAGRGTSLLAGRKPGEWLDVMGPLGKGYTLPSPGRSVAVIGGGIGAAPLFFLLIEIESIYSGQIQNVNVFLGAANKNGLPGAGEISKIGFPLHIATDDGSLGYKGNVVQLFGQVLGKSTVDRIYACGPLPMLKNLSAAVGPESITEVSVEEKMGCGVGACLSCICRVKDKSGESGQAHVCKNGPVFNLRDLIL